MNSKRTLASVALGLGLWAAAMGVGVAADDAAAPSAPDGVIVHAPKKPYDKQIEDFVAAGTEQTRIGQLARWDEKICPLTLGLAPDGDAMVSNRILDMAAQVGAPVDRNKACRPNMAVLFSRNPQALLDQVVKLRPHLLGFHYTAAEAKKLALVQYPVQAWYATATEDYNGRVTDDAPENEWIGTLSAEDILTNATAAEASRLRSGLQSRFASVLVVADSSKIAGRQLGAVADYIAVLALTRSKTLGGCRDLPSITEMFSPECADSQILLQATAADLALLRGLYRVEPTLFGYLQQGSIAMDMERSLKQK